MQVKQHLIFNIVEKSEKNYVICVGNTQISTKTFETVKDAKKYIDSKPYEIITNIIFFTIKLNEKFNKNIENNGNN